MVLTQSELIDALQNEVRILLHLSSKVTPEMLDYRPTPSQRSLIELMRYLTAQVPVMVSSIKAGEFLVNDWVAAQARGAAMDFNAVVTSLESQQGVYAELIGSFSEAEFRRDMELFGIQSKRGPLLVYLVLNVHAGYRMQLFCYLKACGLAELNTMNAWRGVDGSF